MKLSDYLQFRTASVMIRDPLCSRLLAAALLSPFNSDGVSHAPTSVRIKITAHDYSLSLGLTGKLLY